MSFLFNQRGGSNQFSNSLFASFIYLNKNILTVSMENYWKTKKKGGFRGGREGIVDGQRID